VKNTAEDGQEREEGKFRDGGVEGEFFSGGRVGGARDGYRGLPAGYRPVTGAVNR